MSLQQLLPDGGAPDVMVHGLCEDSGAVAAGDAFIAVRGERFDGHQFVADAVANGAVAVLCEDPSVTSCVPAVVVPGLRHRRGELACRFYRDPSAELRCVGITGTNGKTSIAHYVAQLGDALGEPCGYMGTLGWGRLQDLQSAKLTTVDAIGVHRRLRALLDAGCRWVALEVSSHALSQARVDEVSFRVAAFSNLSRDHLDYHGDLAAYGAAKARLFAFDSLASAVINVDDAFGRELLERLPAQVRARTYGRAAANPPAPDLAWDDLQFDAEGVRGRWLTSAGDVPLQLPIAGEFSVANVAAAIASVCELGLEVAEVAEAAKTLVGVPGRMEFFRAPGRPCVVVDYAHTPDALDHVLGALRLHTQGELICVFGCGGDRDRGKRPLMAQAVARHADRLWLTSDNPRSEDPDAIIDDMAAGLAAGAAVHRHSDRRSAIAAALADAGPTDLVVVAGRGHETVQEVAGELRPFSDRAAVVELLGGAH